MVKSDSRGGRRVLVIGWDGATLDLAEPWMKAGYLPNLARLREMGSCGPLTSVLPVLSPSAWASFATGVNPGQHGVFDFAQRDPLGYDLKLVTARDVHAPTLWRMLSEAGKRVLVVNVPMTYPPEPVNGILVSGLGTPDRQVFTHPPKLTETLRHRGYRVNKTVFYRPGGEAAFLKDAYAFTDQVADTALRLIRDEPWDFGTVVFRDTDEMAHFFWKHMDASHPAHDPAAHAPYRNALQEYYQHLDGLTGKLIAAAGPDVDIILMSDHGFGPLYKDVYLNEWLRQQGLLTSLGQVGRPLDQLLTHVGLTRAVISRILQSAGLSRFERWLRATLGQRAHLLPANSRASFPSAIDWQKTQAYSHGYHGQIFINLRGREPQGNVEPGQAYTGLRNYIADGLLELVDPEDGAKVVSQVIPQEAAFSGPYASLGSDLVVIMRDLAYVTRQSYEFAGSAGAILSTPSSFESGSHRLNGMVFYYGRSFEPSGDITGHSILDITPTIMNIMGLPVPQYMDGRVRTEILAPHLRDVKMVATEKYINPVKGEPDQLSANEQAELEERLKNLGYLQ